jgi:hypothetical protein
VARMRREGGSHTSNVGGMKGQWRRGAAFSATGGTFQFVKTREKIFSGGGVQLMECPALDTGPVLHEAREREGLTKR